MRVSNYICKVNEVMRGQNKTLQILFSLALSLLIIFSSVKLTLLFKPLYYFDIQYLNIEEQSNFSKEEIIKNYDYVIDYLLSPMMKEFKLPTIPYSKYGQIHFQDVKKIFALIDILMILTALVSGFGLFINLKYKKFNFLKQSYLMLALIPIVLLTAFIVNFDRAFTIFHKIFFRNDYWLFNPKVDPIINILPQEFFYHSALFIVGLIIVFIITLRLLHKKVNIN